MKVCHTQGRDAIEFAEQSLGLRFPGGTTWVASRFDDNRLAGVAIFTPPQAGNSNLHVAGHSPRWFTPEFAKAMFQHGFRTLNCSRLTATVVEGNEQCLRLTRRVGFREEGYMPGFAFGGLHVFGMIKGECPWAES